MGLTGVLSYLILSGSGESVVGVPGDESLRQRKQLMAGNGPFPQEGVQGKRVSGFLAGLLEAAAVPRGVFFETSIDQRDRQYRRSARGFSA